MAREPVASALISILVAVVLLVFVLYYFFGKRSWFELGDESKAEPALCSKDLGCAGRTAERLQALAKDGELGRFAVALRAAYARNDCAFATELVEGAGRVPSTDSHVADARRAVNAAHVGACGEKREMPPPPPIDAKITIERVKSTATRAAYVVTVRADGKLDWEGKANVGATGKSEGNVERTQVRALFDLFERVRFTKLESEYLSSATDRQIVRITLERGTTRHSVLTDGPCETPAAIEAGLCYLTARIDELVGSNRFVTPKDE